MYDSFLYISAHSLEWVHLAVAYTRCISRCVGETTTNWLVRIRTVFRLAIVLCCHKHNLSEYYGRLLGQIELSLGAMFFAEELECIVDP